MRSRTRAFGKQEGFCVWLTGLSGAGKSTVAQHLVQVLEDSGRTVSYLDGDEVRKILSSELGFSRQDRDTNVMRIGYVASEIVRHGGAAVCAAISPYAEGRAAARQLVGCQRFLLVYVDTPLYVCEERDPKGLYAKARRSEITHFTGVDDPYESPSDADLVLHTTNQSPAECARLVIRALAERGLIEPRTSPTLVESVRGQSIELMVAGTNG